MNALNAVALAGGFLPSAVESVVFIRREGSNEEIEVPADRTTDIAPVMWSRCTPPSSRMR
jgi:protein involved in polysaccharide export with SLBB domain